MVKVETELRISSITDLRLFTKAFIVGSEVDWCYKVWLHNAQEARVGKNIVLILLYTICLT